jgi:hypothetical protein
MNEKLKNLAEKIRKLANIPDDENFGSVIAILMIISIILTLVRVLQECNKNKLSITSSSQDKYALYGSEIKNYSVRRGWFTKMRVKKILREKMSREQYNKYNKALLEAIFNTGENLTDEEVVTLVENANV